MDWKSGVPDVWMWFGDTQLECAPGYDRIDKETSRSTRFVENEALVKWAIDDAFDRGARGFGHLGDLTEYRNPKSSEEAAAARIFMHAFNKGMIGLGVPGNHDMGIPGITSSSFEPLEIMRPESFRVYHKITWVPELRALVIPYMHRMTTKEIIDDVFLAMPEENELDGDVIALIHYGIETARVGPRNLVLPGDYLGAEVFENIPRLKHIFAGHVHDGQEIELIVRGRKVYGHHPGSTAICDMAERLSHKYYCLYNIKTGFYSRHVIPQARKWLQPTYSEIKQMDVATWTENDIVKIVGTAPVGEFAGGVIQDLFRNGFPRPFALEIDVKNERPDRPEREITLTRDGGLRAALQSFATAKAAEEGADSEIILEGMKLALSIMKEQGVANYCTDIWPVSMEIKGYRTFLEAFIKFPHGTPLLITGPNGFGKTNIADASYWCDSGKSFKIKGVGAGVRQDLDDCSVVKILEGIGADGPERYRISRSVHINQKGEAKQTLRLDRWTGEKWDTRSLNDGNQGQIQARYDSLIGGSATCHRVTNYKIQKDQEQFIYAEPASRKGIIGEVIGLQPVTASFNFVDEERKKKVAIARTARDQLAGMLIASEGNIARREELLRSLDKIAESKIDINRRIQKTEERNKECSDQIVIKKTEVEVRNKEIEGYPNTAVEVTRTEGAITARETLYNEKRDGFAASIRRARSQLESVKAERIPLGEPSELRPLEITKSASESALTDAEEVLRTAEARVTESAAEHKNLLRELADLEKSLDEHKGKDIGKCSACDHEIDTKGIEKEIERLNLLISEKKKEIENSLAKKQEFAKEVNSSIAVKDGKKRDSKSAADALQSAVTKNEKIENLKNREVTLETEIAQITTDGQENKKTYDADIILLLADARKALEAHDAQEKNLASLRLTLSLRRDELQVLNERSAEIGSELATARTQFEAEERQETSAKESIAAIDLQEIEVDKARKELPEKEKTAKIYEAACMLLNPKDGMPAPLIAQVLPMLEERINHYAGLLGSGRLTVRLETLENDKETLAILVDNGRKGRALDVLEYSGGQGDRLEYASKFAMADVKRMTRGVNYGFRFFDEPSEGLDAKGKENFLRLIIEQLSDFPVTIFTTHDEEMKHAFPLRWEVYQGDDEETLFKEIQG